MPKQFLPYATVLLAGVSLTLAYAPFSHWFIPFLSLPIVFFVAIKFPDLNGFKLGFAFGAGWFGAGVSWIHVSIANFGGLPLIGSLALMALLVGYLALFPATAFWLNKKLISAKYLDTKLHTKKLQPLSFAIIWFLLEWLRSWLLTGFPWLSIGYSQIDGPLASLYPVIGETGVTFLMILSCFLIALLFTQRKFIPCTLIQNTIIHDIFIRGLETPFRYLTIASIPLTLLIISNIAGHMNFTPENGKQVNVAMVQGNIKQELRWVPEQDVPTMEKYLALSEGLWENDIILWPEAAIPKLEPLSQEYIDYVDQLAFESDTGLITGIVNYNFETSQAYNNLIVLGKTQNTQTAPEYEYFHANRYSKHHLLPFGEFIPLENWIRGLAPIFDLPMSSFTRGDYEQENLTVNDYRLLPAICFEIAFPRQISANLREHTQLLLTVSNDAWFGESHGPAQHLEIAQVRAAEFGLPLLRATNNGITAFVDHKGQLQSVAPQFEASHISTKLQLTQGTTPYRYWGDLPLWIISLITGFVLFLRKKRSS